jgi:thiol-disulfide isomerase/thioredoxin
VTPKKKTDVPTVVFLATMVAAVGLLGWFEARGGIFEEGTPAPPFVLPRLEGEPVSLAELKGRVVVVNFWATWCPPCREEMPYLLKTVQEFEPRGVTLVAISNDDLPEQREVVTEFVKRLPALRPYVALGQGEVGAAYRVKALPSLFVIDRQGRVTASHQGQASEAQIRGWVEAALQKT